MKKTFVAILSFVLCAAAALAGCSKSKKNEVIFVGEGEQTEIALMQKIRDTFNETVGKTEGIKVNYIYKGTDGYSNYVESTAKGRNGADIFIVNDRYFKRWAGSFGILEDIGRLAADNGIALDMDGFYESGSERFRYNVENNTSNPDDPLYGVLRDVMPTILYYNKTEFEHNGVIVISAYAEEIDQAYADRFNAEHGLEGDRAVTPDDLKRGFYRQNQVISTPSAFIWTPVQPEETMVFNNKIAMSWSEAEDLARITTKRGDTNCNTDYGIYQWWWFNYGFSVGGDCIEDITGDGDWVFTVGDDVSNFIVPDDSKGVTVNGHTYAAGETIKYIDRVKLTDSVKADLLARGSTLDDSALTDEVLSLASEGKLLRLPSQRTAFARWVMLGQKTNYSDSYGVGLEVSPQPQTSTTAGNIGWFINKQVAMIVDKSKELANIEREVNRLTPIDKFEWDVAPLPQYREYDDAGALAVHGKMAGASDANAYGINKYSDKKVEALKFIRYAMSDEVQAMLADAAFSIPNNPEAGKRYVKSKPDFNLSIVEDAARYQTPGDWWYMPDKLWIDNIWSGPLNNEVRNGRMSLQEFFDTCIPTANAALQKY